MTDRFPNLTDFFLADLGLQRAGHPTYEWGNDLSSQIRRAGLTHPVLHRLLEEAGKLALLPNSAGTWFSGCCATC